jgi:hypothetical protein
MKIKDYLTAVGIAAGGATVIVFILWLMSLISWAIVWVSLVIIGIPRIYKLAQEYNDSGEIYFTEFLMKKIQKESENEQKTSEIEW